MKAEKVAAIVSQQDPAFSSRECQNLDIPYATVGLSGIHRSYYGMPQPPQFRHDLYRGVLVRIETGH
jgi:hypothetical protein